MIDTSATYQILVIPTEPKDFPKAMASIQDAVEHCENRGIAIRQISQFCEEWYWHIKRTDLPEDTPNE
jgi:hypothetical protein